MHPRVSIITPTYNRSHQLDRAIRSVLTQSYDDFEAIIVDDGSTDDTAEIVSRCSDQRIVYMRLSKNTGGSMVPRKVGLGVSKGEYIAILDDDDYWIDAEKLQSQVSYLDSHPECLLLGTNALAIRDNGETALCIQYPETDNSIRKNLLMRNCFFHSSVMYRRKEMLEAGGYKPIKDGYYANSCNEYDLWCRIGRAGKLVNLPTYSVGYTFPPPHISTKYRIGLLRVYLEIIGNHKDYYPNYKKGVFSHVVATVFELPPVVPLKRYFRKFRLGAK